MNEPTPILPQSPYPVQSHDQTARYPDLQPSTVAQAKHNVYLGLSLTSIMAAALFVMVFIHPKDAVYSNLPLLYAGGALLSGILFNRLAARALAWSEISLGE